MIEVSKNLRASFKAVVPVRGVSRDEFKTLTDKVDGEAKRAIIAEAQLQKKIDDINTGNLQRYDAVRELYVNAGALYNNTGGVIKRTAFWGEKVNHLPGHYYLNGLGDITEEQMAEIYEKKHALVDAVLGGRKSYNFLQGCNLRTLLNDATSPYFVRDREIEADGMWASPYLEVLNLGTNNAEVWEDFAIPHVYYGFRDNTALKAIAPVLKQGRINILTGCPNLQHVRVLVNDDIVIESPVISKESVLYMIQNCVAYKAISIVLPEDAFDRLSAEDDILLALMNKNAELEENNGSINLVSA